MSKTPWFDEAMRDLGMREIVGKKHNPDVVAMFAEAGHAWVKDDETAWCAAAVGAWLKRAGIMGSGSLAARSYLKWGKSLKKKVKRGAIAVFKRGNKSWQGHVAICTGRETATKIEVLGGNQRNAVNTKWYLKSKLLDTRWPPTMGGSRTVKAQVVTAVSSVAGVGAATSQELLPIAQEAAQWSQTMVYVAFGLSAVSALATVIFRLQDMNEKGR